VETIRDSQTKEDRREEDLRFLALVSGLVQPTEKDVSFPVPGRFFGVAISSEGEKRKPTGGVRDLDSRPQEVPFSCKGGRKWLAHQSSRFGILTRMSWEEDEGRPLSLCIGAVCFLAGFIGEVGSRYHEEGSALRFSPCSCCCEVASAAEGGGWRLLGLMI
jgi:hypothetical protein